MNVQQKNPTQSKQGFTIIEVVLVLAIAGLIFLMVFLALPALQRGQRDTQRKNDLSRVSTQITNYSSSNRGSLPPNGSLTTVGTGFTARYLGGTGAVADANEYSDPTTGLGYTLSATAPATLTVGTIYYQTSTICGADGAIVGGTGRQFTLRTQLENQDSPYCIDNR